MDKEFSKNGIVIMSKEEYDDLVNHNAFIMTEPNDCYCYYYTCDYEIWHFYDNIYDGKFKNDDKIPYLEDFDQENLFITITENCDSVDCMMGEVPLDFENEKNKKFLEIDFEVDSEKEFMDQVTKAIEGTEYWTRDEITALNCDGSSTLSWEQYLEAADNNGCSTFSKEFKSEDGEDIVVLQYATYNHFDDFDDTWKVEWDNRISRKENLKRLRGE